MRGLKGKAVVVAGGGGIGAATVERLIEGGARVLVGDLDGTHAEELAARMRAAGGDCHGMRCDIADEVSVNALVEAAVTRFGGIDALHANAADLRAIHEDSNVLDEPLEVFDRTIRVNLRGHWLCTRAALPRLLARGGGSLIYTSSGAACMGEPVRPAYAVSKAGIEALMRHVASGWGKQGIRANAVAPGLVITPQIRDTIPEEFRQVVLRGSRHTRLGEPADIASMVAFLVSDEAAWITGQVLGVNGGAVI
jgi:NAD(P)-dependent dehydrogenase (short-subunit alcohol dehydrogenase family)